ncbi:Immunoglobulin-like domain-containing receptor 2 [Larimichthys crocea]|uniref:Uncharacterized protein n=1 Tax=Larimichthys crocea TaxID=215358 RepID=A0ACD3QHB4_LARCR|nr:Immunoglobulin-like domain-containing receptor 2 [Larimichthys crocea]
MCTLFLMWYSPVSLGLSPVSSRQRIADTERHQHADKLLFTIKTDCMMNFYRLAILLGASVCVCDGVHVTVPEKQQHAMLFQAVDLKCHFQTASTQTPVVQWWSPDLGSTSHLECSDKIRTVRIVASAQGRSLTLAEHYKGRDITIVDQASLRIGKLEWGDSGVYFCKVIISDDLEGKNEGQVELLVLGSTGQQDDLLPEFDVAIMPEWAFVGSVVLGSVLFLLLMGICWCQCCPHSCCCYVRCCCCPETCCCPRHLYEAGRKANGVPPAQPPAYPVLHSWCTYCGSSCTFIPHGSKDGLYPLSGEQPAWSQQPIRAELSSRRREHRLQTHLSDGPDEGAPAHRGPRRPIGAESGSAHAESKAQTGQRQPLRRRARQKVEHAL